MSNQNIPVVALVGLFAAACSSLPQSGPTVGSADNPLLSPAVFRCQASCIRPNGDTKDIQWRECALDGRLAEEDAPAQCQLWKPDAVVNNYAYCEQVRRPTELGPDSSEHLSTSGHQDISRLVGLARILPASSLATKARIFPPVRTSCC